MNYESVITSFLIIAMRLFQVHIMCIYICFMCVCTHMMNFLCPEDVTWDIDATWKDLALNERHVKAASDSCH